MILNIKTGELTEGNHFRKTYWLTKKQIKFLMLLSDNANHDVEEILNFMKWESKRNLLVCVMTLRKHIKSLEIQCRRTIGYKMENIIRLTY